MRNSITDARTIPNAIMDTDHKPVIIYQNAPKTRPTKKRRHQMTFNLRRLQQVHVRSKFSKTVEKTLSGVNPADLNVVIGWRTFKTAVHESLRKVCGMRKVGNNTSKKTRAWWNDKVKEAIKQKKKLYKKWIKSKTDEDYQNYRTARKTSKLVVKAEKEASWIKYGKDLSEKCRRSPREFYKSVKAMRIRNEPFDPTTIINDVTGKPLHNEGEILQRWEDYFKNLLNPDEGADIPSSSTPSHPEHLEPKILTSEVEKAIRTSSKGKAAGIDGITTEIVMACGAVGIKWITTIIQKAWHERTVPEDWKNAIVIPIWKNKGSRKDCSNYRGLSLNSHVGKLYAKILEQRARAKAECYLSNAQFGFRKGRGCTDAIFTLRQLCESTVEHNRTLQLVFIDQEKAFDRVDREKLWRVLEL